MGEMGEIRVEISGQCGPISLEAAHAMGRRIAAAANDGMMRERKAEAERRLPPEVREHIERCRRREEGRRLAELLMETAGEQSHLGLFAAAIGNTIWMGKTMEEAIGEALAVADTAWLAWMKHELPELNRQDAKGAKGEGEHGPSRTCTDGTQQETGGAGAETGGPSVGCGRVLYAYRQPHGDMVLSGDGGKLLLESGNWPVADEDLLWGDPMTSPLGDLGLAPGKGPKAVMLSGVR
jgi:hypothetical protein